MENLFEDPQRSIRVHALFVGERIDLKPLEPSRRAGGVPILVSAGARGRAAVFRYGAIVLFDLQEMEELAFLRDLRAMVHQPIAEPVRELIQMCVQPEGEEGVSNGTIVLRDVGLERVEIVAHVLAKSVAMEHYEKAVVAGFSHIEDLAHTLKEHGNVRQGSRQLLKSIGEALLTEHRMANRVEVTDKPDLLWERVDLEPFYLRLEREFELPERRVSFEHRLGLVSRTAQTVLDLLDTRRSLRVEWYIVILIVFEILLTLYDMFLRH